MRIYFARGAVLALLAASSLLPTPGRADDAGVRKALEKQYARIDQAFKSKNIKPVSDVSTPDYTVTLPSGQVATRPQMEQQFGTMVSFIQTVKSASTKINKATVKGGTATVDTVQTVSGVLSDPQTQGKTHTLDLSTSYHDLWVKTGTVWLRKHSDLLKSNITMDGKKQDVGAMMGGAGAPRR